MNENLRTAGKFKRISIIIFGAFFILTIILAVLASYFFNNYWLLFGILFSYLGNAFYNTKFIKVFYFLTIALIIYWFYNGFSLKQELTFFWLSFLFGNICKYLINVYDNLSKTIIDGQTSEINDMIKRGVEAKRGQNDK